MGSMQNQCNYRLSVKGVIFNEARDKILLCKESIGDIDIWSFPGGGVDHGENLESCLRREIKEEMGLQISHFHPQTVGFATYRNYKNTEWRAAVCYEISLEHFDFTPSDECLEIGFFTIKMLSEIKTFENVPGLFDQLLRSTSE